MKRVKIMTVIVLMIALIMSLSACGLLTQQTPSGSASLTTADSGSNSWTDNRSSQSGNSTLDATVEPVIDDSVTAEETTGEFSISSEDGTFSQNGDVYTITSAGTYVLSGLLEGQILIDAGEEDEVILELSGVTITYGEDSPIKVVSAGNVDISAKKDTENVINDTRSLKTMDDENQGEGAIYATCDLKMKGSGTLVINAGYNNGIHTTKDLKIQKITLKVTAYNNAIKGNDSVTILSGTVIAISTNGDGIKTENTDLNKSGIT